MLFGLVELLLRFVVLFWTEVARIIEFVPLVGPFLAGVIRGILTFKFTVLKHKND
jgi:hypothetical protein